MGYWTDNEEVSDINVEQSSFNEEPPGNVEGYREFHFPVVDSIFIDVEAPGFPLPPGWPQNREDILIPSNIYRSLSTSSMDQASAVDPLYGPVAYEIACYILKSVEMILRWAQITLRDYSEYLYANVGTYMSRSTARL